ncbi:MAG: acido-empty-quinoprotein group A, partial [Bryobacteraceae bacterium]
MKIARALFSLAICAAAVGAQELDPAKLLKPPTDTWPSYNGDYSGRRFSPLKQINASNVRNLTLKWLYKTGDAGGDWVVKSTPLEVNGILYFTVPNNVWAVDARNGHEI